MSRNTRELIGVITSWGVPKPITTGRGSFNRRTFFLDNTPNQFGHSIKGSLEVVTNEEKNFPVGTWVKVIEEQNGDYWNVTKLSFCLNTEKEIELVNRKAAAALPRASEKTANTPQKESKQVISGPDKERICLRENSGYIAAAFMDLLQKQGHLQNKSVNEIELQFLSFAEKWEEVCMRPIGQKILQGDLP